MRREGGQYSLLRGQHIPTNKTLRTCESCWRNHLEKPLRGKLDIHQFARLNNSSKKNKTNRLDNPQYDDADDNDELSLPQIFVQHNAARMVSTTLTFIHEDGKGKFPHKDLLIRYLRRCQERKEVVDVDEFLASVGTASSSNCRVTDTKKHQRRPERRHGNNKATSKHPPRTHHIQPIPTKPSTSSIRQLLTSTSTLLTTLLSPPTTNNDTDPPTSPTSTPIDPFYFDVCTLKSWRSAIERKISDGCHGSCMGCNADKHLLRHGRRRMHWRGAFARVNRCEVRGAANEVEETGKGFEELYGLGGVREYLGWFR
ncbi:hypothetical protein HK102_008439 [Quaeritorhiza haematococci]|nr:hypothetical protein HK102_008439 [Quaeritorhiza haematococci]